MVHSLHCLTKELVMKAEVKKSEGFQPIDLCIKIETEEDLSLLNTLFGHNATVVVTLSETGVVVGTEEEKLKSLMAELYYTLKLNNTKSKGN